jgi:hypothetical protein
MHGRNAERMRHTRIIVTHYGEPDPRSLRIDDAVQVERWRGYWRLTKHQMDLPSMVRLVIEQMTACHVRRLHVIFALIIRVSERPAPKRGIEPREERLDPRIFSCLLPKDPARSFRYSASSNRAHFAKSRSFAMRLYRASI